MADSDDIYYRLTGPYTACVTGARLEAIEYVKLSIPPTVTHNGRVYTVTAIADRAFANDYLIYAATIPNTVTTIGKGAFSRTSLTEIVIPNSVTSIGPGAFEECQYLKSVTLSNSMTCIERDMFIWCSSLESVTIPDGITSIGEHAFSYTRLLSVSLPLHLVSIGELVFERTQISELVIPFSVELVGRRAFYNCIQLNDITCMATYPPECGEMAFGNFQEKCVLHVPPMSVAYYQCAPEWKDFAGIVGDAGTPAGIAAQPGDHVRVCASGGSIVAEGIAAGVDVRVFTVDGAEVFHAVSAGDPVVFTPPCRGIWFVTYAGRSTRVAL